MTALPHVAVPGESLHLALTESRLLMVVEDAGGDVPGARTAS